ncbi:MAG: alginate lyase family protein [Pirellulales bacterium]|jgi:hypothetical protein|nr:alginate lyase family protein [Thermoguttaceae bacterium]MDD4788240.1 alginate lyase family protein [Pirellulales bacterium]NLY99066.1 alginate lyase family protein [Pirellulaceae bacterium]
MEQQCLMMAWHGSRRRPPVAAARIVLACLAALLAGGLAAGEVLGTDRLTRVFLVDGASLATTRQRVAAGDPALADALARLRHEAQSALQAGPFSVVDKKSAPPSGDRHDYMSLGPYWWPDPGKPGGLPYIRRDGQVNPEGEAFDRKPLNKMTSAVETLALAYYLTGHGPYAEHAARLLRAWFLDEATRMNPHLKYGQAIPGRTEGRGIGIIDTAQLTRLVDAVGMLAGAPCWTAADQRGLEAWFRQYLAWLRESRHGRDESRAGNNHGTWYDVQVATFALFAGEEETARDVLQKAAARRIAAQIEPDGRQPQELARTRSFDYSTMNLRGMFELATLGQRLGIDLWHFESTDGRSIRRALDWLIPFALGEKRWPHEQLGGLRPARLASLLRRAAAVYQEPRYERAVRRLAGADASDRMHLLLPEPRRSNQQSAAVRPNGLFGAWRAGGALDHRP